MPKVVLVRKPCGIQSGNTLEGRSVSLEPTVLSQQPHRLCVLFVTVGVDERRCALYLMVVCLPFENEVLVQR